MSNKRAVLRGSQARGAVSARGGSKSKSSTRTAVQSKLIPKYRGSPSFPRKREPGDFSTSSWVPAFAQGCPGNRERLQGHDRAQPERIPVAGLGPGHPRLRCGDSGWLKTWVPGTSLGKGLLGAKFGPKTLVQTALEFSPDSPARSRGRRVGPSGQFPGNLLRGGDRKRWQGCD
jgi:hypothetical protein